ncbi:MAG: hypothetical protein IPP71_03095 [Bacteroidetes bacterium]|nr:hypothetical protein [Bacteroidota bacterium]
MKLKWNTYQFYGVAVLLMIILISGRFLVSGNDFSYFFVAGTDFVEPSKTVTPIVVQQGQGYDGQFFYRYALNPFDFSQTNYGIKVDLVPYRMQRIGYPLLVWLFSLGGNGVLVPFFLVFVNMLAYLGILFFTQRFIKFSKGREIQGLMTFFLFGIYMSLARDLSEVTELFFFLGAVYYYFNKDIVKFSLLAAMTVLCRETSVLALAPLILIGCFNTIQYSKKYLNLFWFGLPVFIFISWKWFVGMHVESEQLISGSGNLGMPFVGLYHGFLGNLDISTTKNKLQLIFWILYFVWQCWLIIKVISAIRKNKQQNRHILMPLSVIYITWLTFAVFLSAAIYIDDWSFVRVFSLWNMTGILILIVSRNSTGNAFNIYSCILIVLTLGRLIIRP